MLAYMVIGIILGWLAWQLKHEDGDPQMVTQMIFGVVGAVIGGVGTNLVLLEADLMAISLWGFLGAVVLAVVVLGVLQTRVGRS